MDRLAGRVVRTIRGESDDTAVVGIDDEAADQVFDALASETPAPCWPPATRRPVPPQNSHR